MRIADLFSLLAPPHIRMHHLAYYRAGPDDGNLHDKVVEPLGIVAGQRCHLCAALHLEHAYRVGSLQRLIDFFVFGQLRQIDLLAVVLRDQFKAVLDNGHHAKTQQVYLDDAQIGAVLFVPLHDRAARHRCTFQWNDMVELSLANDHAARVLSEMTGQLLDAHAEFEILGDTRMMDIETGIAERMGHRVGLPTPLPIADQARQTAQRLFIEAKGFADLAGSRLAAIGDDIRSHGSAKFAVTLVNILNGLFALTFGWEVEIDVRPLSSTFAEESFEQQLHANRVNGGYFECITNSGVGGASPTLN